MTAVSDLEFPIDLAQSTQTSGGAGSANPNISITSDSTCTVVWPTQGEYRGPKESVLPREFRQNLYKQFARIEHEFEREYRRLYGEYLSLQERLEKFEDADHSESTTLAKKLGASMLSQRIKQQYKQSTSRLVSSLRQSSGHFGVANPFSVTTTVPHGSCVITPNVAGANAPVTPATTQTIAPNYPMCTTQVLPSLVGTFASHGGTWQLINRISAHRDGIWEVTPHGKLLATASADNTARLWSNDFQLNCLLIYVGHCGSVNSVRFRNRDHLLLTSSGDGTAHLIRLPYDMLVKAAAAMTSSSASGTAAATLEAATSALATEVAGSASMSLGTGTGMNLKVAVHSATGPDSDDGNFSSCVGQTTGEDDSPVRLTTNVSSLAPIYVRHPHSIFQSANLGPTLPGLPSGALSTGASLNSCMDSSPLSAADFLTGRDQLVTAGWDRLGRIYDLPTGQEINLLTGHDNELTDVRCAPDGSPLVVTSSRDCTFRLWDFRQPGIRVHVQQAHAQTISTTQFLTGGPNKRLISAGGDRLCRIWDLRQSRGPLVTIRTDSGINRFALSGGSLNPNFVLTGDAIQDPSSAVSTNANFTSASATGDTTVSEGASSATASAICPAASTGIPSSAWATSYTRILALPLNNRGIKFFDINGSRIGRVARSSSRIHARMVTSVAWADEGLCNFFSTGFDSRLLAWQIHLPV